MDKEIDFGDLNAIKHLCVYSTNVVRQGVNRQNGIDQINCMLSVIHILRATEYDPIPKSGAMVATGNLVSPGLFFPGIQ